MRWLPPRLVVVDGAPAGLTRALSQAVGAHHGRYHSGARRRDHVGRYEGYDRGGWAEVQDQALDWLAQTLFGDDRPLVVAPPDVSALVLSLSGLTSICDWIGSSANDFPPTGDRIGSDRYAEHARARAVRAVERPRGCSNPRGCGPQLMRSGRNAPPSRLPALPGTCTRPVQQAVVALAGPRAGSPGLLVVEAPMGEGKTEAAFWWAAACQASTCRGVYLALPTQATSNAMLPRLRKTLEGVSPGGIAPAIRLIHGAAALQTDRGTGHVTPNTPGADDRRAALDAESWFAPRKRTLWATYAVGTVDQALMAALAVKHGFVRLAGLATKAVVIDEVHAYDVYMTSILERLLRWLAALGTPVALLSATLPAARRARLIAAYAGADPVDGPASYPLVALADPSGRVEWVEPATSGRGAEVAIERCRDPGDDSVALNRLAADLRARIAGGGCLAWIHNTVDGAQRAYQARRTTAERLTRRSICGCSTLGFGSSTASASSRRWSGGSGLGATDPRAPSWWQPRSSSRASTSTST